MKVENFFDDEWVFVREQEPVILAPSNLSWNIWLQNGIVRREFLRNGGMCVKSMRL